MSNKRPRASSTNNTYTIHFTASVGSALLSLLSKDATIPEDLSDLLAGLVKWINEQNMVTGKLTVLYDLCVSV